MGKIDIELPPYTIFRQRKGWRSYYFSVPKSKCPEGWIPVIKIGNDDTMGIDEIIKKAKDLKVQFDKIKTQNELQIERKPVKGTMPDIVNIYEDSKFFKKLRKNTQRDYKTYIREILAWSTRAGHPQISDLTTKGISLFLDRFEPTPEKQKQMKNVLSMLFKIAIREGYVIENLAVRVSLMAEKKRKREIVIWTDEDVTRFVSHADASGWGSVGTAVLIAYETGQRMGDVLSLQKPRDYNNGRFSFKQSKTGAMVSIRATQFLYPRLEAIPDEQFLLVRNENTGQKWSMYNFTHRVRKIADSCGMTKHIFKELRHSARLKAERAGLTNEEMTKTFGWSRGSVLRMGDLHYGVNFDEETAESVVDKIDDYRKKKAELNVSKK